MENVIVIASNSFSNMDFLPPTPLMIDCCTWQVLEKSLNGGNLRLVLRKNQVSHQKFFLLGYPHSLSLPRIIGKFIRKQISNYEFLIIG
jgi:hypothetical protein